MIPISISPFFVRVFFAGNGCLKRQGVNFCIFMYRSPYAWLAMNLLSLEFHLQNVMNKSYNCFLRFILFCLDFLVWEPESIYLSLCLLSSQLENSKDYKVFHSLDIVLLLHFCLHILNKLLFPFIYSVSTTTTFNNSKIYFWHILWYEVNTIV